MSPVVGDKFGAIKTRNALASAVEATIKLWQEEYLAEIERQEDLDPHYLPLIKAWERSHKGVRKHVGNMLPAVCIQVPSLADHPVRRKEGTSVTWNVLVSIIVSGPTQADTEYLGDLYTAAFRALIEQNKSLGGYAAGAEWIDERYDDIADKKRANLGCGSAVFEIEVEKTVQSYLGPHGTPGDNPYDDIREDDPVVSVDGVPNNVITIEEL